MKGEQTFRKKPNGLTSESNSSLPLNSPYLMLRLIGWGSSDTSTCESIFVHWRSSYYNTGIVILPLPSQGRRVRTQWQTGKSLSTVKSPSAFPVLNPSSREFKFANLSELRYVGTYQTCFMTSKKTNENTDCADGGNAGCWV